MAIFYTDTGSLNNLQVTGSALVSGTLLITGSFEITGSGYNSLDATIFTGPITASIISASSGITGSLFGTASYATTASVVIGSVVSASYAISSSNAITAFTSSWADNVNTASWADNATTSSHAVTASYIQIAASSSFATTASFLNPLVQRLIVTGSLLLSGSTSNELTVVGETLITGSLVISGSQTTYELDVKGDTIITGSLIVSGGLGAGVFSKGGTVADLVNLVAISGSYLVWRTPFSCSAVAMYGRKEGGGTTQINARRSGSGQGYALHTASNLFLSTDAAWIQSGAIRSQSYVPGDSLEIIISGSGNQQVAVQVDFIRTL